MGDNYRSDGKEIVETDEQASTWLALLAK